MLLRKHTGQKVKLCPWPFGYKCAFIIRDDDVSYFTKSEMLDKIYGKAWNLGFKVSLAVIPNHRTTDYDRNIPPHFRGNNKQYLITNNFELVRYLLKKLQTGEIDIIQHGYSHESYNGLPEFKIRHEKILDYKLKLGRKILETTFNIPIKVFVAPHDSVSTQAWNMVNRNELDLCRTYSLIGIFGNIPKNFNNIITLSRLFKEYPHPFKIPFHRRILEFSNTLEFQSSFLFNSESNIKDLNKCWHMALKAFNEVYQNRDLFYVINHYWDYFYDWENKISRNGLLKCFNKFLNYVNKFHRIWKTTFSELSCWIKLRNLIQTKLKQNKLQIFSPHLIKGLTFQFPASYNIKNMNNEQIKVIHEDEKTFVIIKELNTRNLLSIEFNK